MACVDCGADVRGERCRTCNNRLLNQQRSERLAEGDAWLIEQAKTRPVADIAAELGVVRATVYNRLAAARARA